MSPKNPDYPGCYSPNFSCQHYLDSTTQLAQERAEAVIMLASEQGFTFELALGIHLQSWAMAEQGQGTEGIAQIHRSLAALQALGAKMVRPYYLALLAEAHGKVGQVEEGLSVLAEALTVVDRTGERVSEAELYRLNGELTLQQSSVQRPESSVQKEAEQCFHRAIDITRKQRAKSLELRATVSLAHLWQQQDKQKEGHRMLAEIYGWFTEGFDTKDLQEAKALLEELS